MKMDRSKTKLAVRKTVSLSACLGSLGTVFSTAAAMGCCAGVLAPLASIAAVGVPLFDSPSFQMPALYAAVGVTLIGLVAAYRRHRSLWFVILGAAGATILLIPFHMALEVSVFNLLIGLGLGGILLGSWGPLVGLLLHKFPGRTYA